MWTPGFLGTAWNRKAMHNRNRTGDNHWGYMKIIWNIWVYDILRIDNWGCSRYNMEMTESIAKSQLWDHDRPEMLRRLLDDILDFIFTWHDAELDMSAPSSAFSNCARSLIYWRRPQFQMVGNLVDNSDGYKASGGSSHPWNLGAMVAILRARLVVIPTKQYLIPGTHGFLGLATP